MKFQNGTAAERCEAKADECDAWKLNSAAKCIKALRAFTVEKPEWQLTQLSRELNIPKSTLLSILRTLQSFGYVRKQPNQCYRLGVDVLELAYNARGAIPILQYAVPLMEDIQQATGKIVYFTIPKNGKVLYLEGIYPGKRNVTYSVTGKTLLLHCTGCGKAILSEMSEEQVRRIVEVYGLPRFTSTTITDYAELQRELQETRERGYAIDNGEEGPGVRCVATAIKSVNGPLGALSISGSVINMPDNILESYAELLTHASMLLASHPEAFPQCDPMP